MYSFSLRNRFTKLILTSVFWIVCGGREWIRGIAGRMDRMMIGRCLNRRVQTAWTPETFNCQSFCYWIFWHADVVSPLESNLPATWIGLSDFLAYHNSRSCDEYIYQAYLISNIIYWHIWSNHWSMTNTIMEYFPLQAINSTTTTTKNKAEEKIKRRDNSRMQVNKLAIIGFVRKKGKPLPHWPRSKPFGVCIDCKTLSTTFRDIAFLPLLFIPLLFLHLADGPICRCALQTITFMVLWLDSNTNSKNY